ncbi:MAG: hypothetical protein KDJ38_03445, partial [Gammaproteobacteria bacterium]|nr:hypothetical protein [Gammaproteobacteria bacterium]
VSRYGKKAFDDFLTRAMPASDFLLGQLSENLDTGEVGGKAKLAQDAKPLIKSMPDGVYKQLMIKRLETVVGTSLNEPITTSSPQQAEPASRVNPPANASRSAVLRRAVALTLQKPAVAAQLADESCLFKTDSIGGELLLGLVKLCKSNPTISTASLLAHFRDTTHFNGLSKLAYQELLPSHLELSDEAAEQELGDIMRRLSRQSQKRDALLVQPSQQVGLLSLRKSRVPS